jgi:alkylation response protein AidB-like acyl-CoA dehydrogenase
MISLRLNEKAEQLRSEFLAWLRNNPPPEIVGPLELDEFVEISVAWQKALAKEHWIAVHWPERFGGRGLSVLEEAVIQECLVKVRAPQLVNLFGLNVVGSVLIASGTEAQCERFLPGIRAADELWCQGFAEPEAGSDLASLSASAQWSGEGWRITGEKIWTSYAQYAQWCFCLVRTDPQISKHEGLSCFVVPMDARGLAIQPLLQISGDREFSRVSFDKVPVPAANMVGMRGAGWEIALRALGFKDAVVTLARHLESEIALAEIGGMLKERNADQVELERYGRLAAKHMALRALALKHADDHQLENPGFEGALDRLAWSETYQEICKFALELGGLSGLIEGDKEASSGGILRRRYLCSRGSTIASGTSEIQRNIVAEKILGLPKGT